MEKLENKEIKSNLHVIGGLELNEDTREVSVDGEIVKMTPTEYKDVVVLV